MGDYLARPMIQAGQLVQVLRPFASDDRAHWLCYRDRRHLPHRVNLLVQHLIDSFPAAER
jgi:DNA-binding transcriptional LysR family regulator